MNQPSTQLLFWLIGSGLLMSSISLIGAFTFFLPEAVLKSILLPLVSFAAGSLIASSMFYLLPESIEMMGNNLPVYMYLMGGFLLFFVLEQFLHWHHSHSPDDKVHDHHHHQPLTYLVLVSHTVHNFVDGIAVGGSFLIDVRVGIFAWIGVAMHEIPQKLGDYSILLHGGWKHKKAMLYNFLSSMSFLLGSLVVFFLARTVDMTFLLPFAAGMFLYVAAVDLVPEIKHHHRLKTNVVHFLSFLAGLVLILAFRMLFEHHHT